MKLKNILLLAAGLLAFAPLFAHADLAPSGGNDSTAIQAAIDGAGAGGTVTLGEGTFLINTQLTIGNGVTLVGQGYDRTTLKYTGTADQSTSRVATVRDYGVLSSVTVTGGKVNGNNEGGGGVLINGGGTVTWCKVTDNYAKKGAGGGIAVRGSGSTAVYDARIDHTIVANNACGTSTYENCGGGIGVYTANSMLMNRVEIDTCLVYGNSVGNASKAGHGAGIGFDINCSAYSLMSADIRNTTVVGNSATGTGGGVYINFKPQSKSPDKGKVTLVNNIIADNSATVCDNAASFADIAFASEDIKNNVAGNVSYCFFGLESEKVGSGSSFGDPGFVGDGNYHLSAALKLGYETDETFQDLDGNERTGELDVGCYMVSGVAPHVHVWGEPGYSWNTTAWTCTASATCTLNESHTTNETVVAQYAVVTPATESTTGLGRYTATFTSSMFVEQTYDVIIPKQSSGDELSPAGEGNDDSNAIQRAIDQAGEGGTVKLGEGTFLINTQLMITNGVTLIGHGRDKTMLKYNGAADQNDSRVATISGGAVLSSVTVTGGKVNTGHGGGLQINGSGTVTGCAVTNNCVQRGFGGGIRVNGSSTAGNVRIDHTIVSGNTAGLWSANSAGGGIYVFVDGSNKLGKFELDTCLVAGNSVGTASYAKNGGGVAIEGYDQTVFIRNTTIVGNTASGVGGGLYLKGSVAKNSVTLTNDIFAGNTAGSAEGNVAVSDTLISDRAVTAGCLFGLESEKFGTGSVSGDPRLSADFRPTSDSTLVVGKGTAYEGIGTDLDGNLFADPPSIGCYELGGIVPHVHVYPETNYVWAADNSSCTASVTCSECSVTVSETVPTQYEVVTPATKSETGLGRYTAVFTKPVFETQIREVVIPRVPSLVAGEPKVSEVGQTSAKLEIPIVSVGDDATGVEVVLSWGTDPAALDHSEVVSPKAQLGDSVTKALGGLTPNTRYYYRFALTNDAAEAEHAEAAGAFMTDDPAVEEAKKSDHFVAPEAGEVVTYHADTAGDPETYDVGNPYWTVNATEYTRSYTTTVGAGQTFWFRNEDDFRYNASARIRKNDVTTYYLFLSDAVDAAETGDTIELLRNNYAVGETMSVSKSLIVKGNGFCVKVAQPFLDKQGFVNPECTESVKNVFKVENGGDLRLEDMLIMGGGERLTDSGAGSYDGSTPAVTLLPGGLLEMDHVTIKRSQGGLFLTKSAGGLTAKARLNACNLVRNARYCGGGLHNYGVLVMENSSLSENRSLDKAGGGAAAQNNGLLVMNNCVICNNGSTEYGGAINNLRRDGAADKGIIYMMNMTMAGNFSSNDSDLGGGLGLHVNSGDLYTLNCILCNNYHYVTTVNHEAITVSDIRSDSGNNNFLYSVYGVCTGGMDSRFDDCRQVDAEDQDVFKGYSEPQRTYEQAKTTKVAIPGPAFESDPSSPDARYAPLTVKNSKADMGEDGVYTYFDASDWRNSSDNGDVSHIRMSYRTKDGVMTALGNCPPAGEDDLVTTYYESAFAPNVTARELGVVGASGFGSVGKSYNLYLTRKPENGGVSDNLTLQGSDYPEGSEVTVVATPAAACSFAGWYDQDDNQLSTKTSYTFVMDSDKWMYARFTPPASTHVFNVDCEQAAVGTHGKFPLTITTNWLAAAFGSICPGGIVPDEKVSEVEAALNAADDVNGLSHVWMNYVLGAMLPGDPDGRIWIRGAQTPDRNTLKFGIQEFSETLGCGFRVRYRLATRNLSAGAIAFDRTREYWQKTIGSFEEDVSSDSLQYRVIDMVFIPTNSNSSCEYVTTVNTAGVMKVASSKKIEILGAPWGGFSPTNNPAVKATDYVKAACLSVNDVLYVYDRENQNYLAWTIQNDGTWAAVKTFTLANGVITESVADATRTNDIPRGAGVWLERKDTTKPILLYGQVDPSPVTTSLESGFNLVANPYPTAFAATSLAAPATAGEAGDRVVIPTGDAPINACYRDGAWKTPHNREITITNPVTGEEMTGYKTEWSSEGLSLPVGLGFWYFNAGSGSVELTWPVVE